MVLTQEGLRQIFRYDPESGIVTRISRTSNRIRLGDAVGTLHRTGYLTVEIMGKQYPLHRIIWMMVEGKWPAQQIDHKDTDRANNRWANLREATNGQNTCNQKLRVTSKTGLKGVSFVSTKKKYKATIGLNNKDIHLGFHDCKACASFAYQIAADTHFGTFSRIF